MARNERKESILDRIRLAMIKHDDQDVGRPPATETRSVEELEAASRWADDKERLVGLLAAPIAAAIGFLIITALVDHDPAATLANGKPNPQHVNPTVYHDLLLVLLVLTVLMVATAFWRKRLFLGITTALFGLAVFNLHYWGFGIPFVMVGAWLLVRSYRAQQALKAARAAEASPTAGLPRPSKRYTPPKGLSAAAVTQRRAG